MKYWAYLNDEVSQKSYTEEELQQLPGFGPDVLICSEASAVSREPEWKPVREVLPHLIRPKAPDFSKFRPAPPAAPVSASNNVSGPFGSQKETPVEQKSQVVMPNTVTPSNDLSGLNSNLLAQLQSLTEKIASLENKIEEQEMPLSNASPDFGQNIGEETFVSDPKSEQEDDVLEVPFDSDFEVPFDVNKSSEEIAREAEAILAKPATEIEEYNTDEQNAELMHYDSDMQKILEDTVRETDFYKQQKPQKTEPKIKQGVFIAEDLISKKTLKFTAKSESDDNKEAADQESKTENEKQEVSEQQERKQENIIEEQPEEKQEKIVEQQEETKEDIVEEQQEEKQEEKQEEIAEQQETDKDENKGEDKQEAVAKENAAVKKEEAEEESQPQEQNEPEIRSLDDLLNAGNDNPTKEQSKEQIEEQVEEVKPQLVSLDDAKVKNVETPAKEEEVQAKPQLSEVESAPKAKEYSSDKEEIENVAHLVSLDEMPGQKDEEPVKDEIKEEREISEKEEKEEKAEEKQEEVPEQQEEKQELVEENSLDLSADEVSEGNSKDSEQEDVVASDKDVETVSLEDISNISGMTQNLQIAKESEEEKREEKDNDELNILESDVAVYTAVTETENPEDEDNKRNEQTSNLSVTNSVTISEDDTTAAVLDEIAQEKGLTTQNITDSEKLFEELENNNKNESEDLSQLIGTDEQSSEENNSDSTDGLEDEFGKEDEFLKTFTTSVEEVFLDQPTAIISDYVPPNIDGGDHVSPAALNNMDSIKREKPSDIKTVPLVPEALGQEIHSSPYVESATAKLRRKSMLVGLVKVIVAIIFISAMVLMALATLAVTGKISEKLSPLHTIGYLWQKNKQEKTEQPANTAQDLTPEIIDENQSAEQAPQSEAKEEKNVLDIVKDYVFSDGTTLEDRIEHSHQNLSGNIEWSFVPTEEQNIYSIAVKIPQNKDGQGFSYLFNYNSNENVLTPTTSESKNIMENYSK